MTKKIKLPLTPNGNVDKRTKEYKVWVGEQTQPEVSTGGTGITGIKYEALNTEPKKSVLDTAKEIIYGDREAVYGDPAKNLKCIANFWEMYLYSKYGAEFPLDVNDICAMMRLLKEARLINTPTHLDSLTDICGYSALQERVMK